MGKPLTTEKARFLAWKRGRLRFKLDPNQQDIYDRIKANPRRKFYLNCGRRVGKTYLFAVLAIETALRRPGAVIKVAAPTAKAVRQFLMPIYKDILKDAPLELRARIKHKSLDNCWHFEHNDSRIYLVGCDNGNHENLRGPACDLFLFDECGFIDELKYISDSIAAPMLLTTDGSMLYASTPPTSSDHEAIEIFRDLESLGCAVTRTIFDNPRLTDAQRNAFISEQAGMMTVDQYKQTIAFRREYMAELITDTSRAVIPEWSDEAAKALVGEVQRPAAFDAYVAMDLGWRDGTGILFGYWDFLDARLVVEDEILLFNQIPSAIGSAMGQKERQLWGSKSPALRVSDNNLLVIAEINTVYGMEILPTPKNDKEMAVNRVREMVQEGKIRIHPRCKQLIKQLHTTIWNKERKQYERNKDGHGDLLDALVYMVRNLRRDVNPYPRKMERDPAYFYPDWTGGVGGVEAELSDLFKLPFAES